MSKNMTLTSGDELSGDECFDFVLPRFVLCLRDFFLDLERDGKEITADQYLDDCLESRPGDSHEDRIYNRPRECIKKYFKKRKVFTFDRPGGKRLMKKLETAHDDELSDDFKEVTMKFTSFVFQCEPKKLINKQIVRGSMLAKVAREYVKSMREGGVPCVDDAMTTMCRMENEKAVKKAVAEFDEKMKALELPVYDCKTFLGKRYKLQAQLIIALNKRMLFDDNNEAEKSAEEEMESIARAVEERNAKMLQDRCMDKLKKLYIQIADKMNEFYKVAGGYQTYMKDMEAFEKTFDEQMSVVESAEGKKAFKSFVSVIKNDAEEILQQEQQLSKEEEEKLLATMAEKAKQRIKESEELLSRKLKEQKLAHEKDLAETREEQRRTEATNLNAVKAEWLAPWSPSENLEELKKEKKRLRTQRDSGVISKTWSHFSTN